MGSGDSSVFCFFADLEDDPLLALFLDAMDFLLAIFLSKIFKQKHNKPKLWRESVENKQDELYTISTKQYIMKETEKISKFFPKNLLN